MPASCSRFRYQVEGQRPEAGLKVKLRVINVASGETRVCQFEKTKTWDWSNAGLVRVVDELQITRWPRVKK